MLREQLDVHPRLAAVEPLQEALAGELDEVPEAPVVLGQQREVVALHPPLADAPVVHEVGLEAEQRLDAVLLGALYSSTAPFITPWSVRPMAGWPKLPRALGERVHLAGAVEQRVLGVDVQMGDGRRAHGERTIGTTADGKPGPLASSVRSRARVPLPLPRGVRRVVNASGRGSPG